ncbi:MAG: response regulator [Nitrospirae bacterium]|nr:response regulator [Nitrospirota bacterium]
MSHKILIVEDNEKNRQLIVFILKHYGYEIIEAVNGEEGVRLAKEHKPDLVIMDIQMPVMDGLTAIKLLKEDKDTRDITIIAATSFAMKGDREKIIFSGADDYISKPIDTRALPELLKKYLG